MSDADPENARFELAALRLHLLVGMAAADGRVEDDEHARLQRFVDSALVTTAERTDLRARLEQLVTAPPKLDDLLRALIDRIEQPTLAQMLVDDLVTMAKADGHVDPREEGMIRLVCGALEIDPVSLYDDHERAGGDASAAELAALVRNLLGLSHAS